MIQLTKREWTIYTFIATFIHEHGYAPSTKEIAASIGKRMGGGINDTVHKLAQKGVIHRCAVKGAARAIALVRGVRVGVAL